MRGVLRMIDANANRAAEALRTLEDVARLTLGAGALSARLRSLRHEVRRTVSELGGMPLAAARDAAADPGSPERRTVHEERPGGDPREAALSTAGAGDTPTPAPPVSRRGTGGIAAAAASRAGEALRALEEALRAVRPDLAGRIERIRFDAYDAAAQTVLAAGTGAAKQWRCCVILTECLCRRPWREVLRAALDGGADMVQVREKALAGAALLERAREVLEISRPHGAAVIVNDRADVALAAGADGVHVGTEDLPIRDVRLLGGPLLVGASTHGLDEAEAAVAAGADYCGVGAMFPTSTKPDREASGPAYLRAFIERFPQVPHLAIGGIDAARAAELAAAGCRGVAVSGAVCGAEDPGAATAAIVAALSAACEVRA